MARLKIPYLISQQRKDGSVRYYFQPSTVLRRLGWRPRRLSDDEGEAIAAARQLNADIQAWRKGTRPAGAPPETPTVQPGSVAALIRSYKASRAFTTKAATTRKDYEKQMAKIEAWAGDTAAAALTVRHVSTLYETLAARSPTQANGLIRVLRILLGHGEQTLDLPRNVARQVRITGVPPRLRVWTPEEVDAAVAAADALGRPSIGDAILVAADTAQRQGDVLSLPLIAATLDDRGAGKLRLRQSKRRAMIAVDLTPRLAARLAEAAARRPADAEDPALVLSETTKAGYKADDFRHQFAAVRRHALAAAPSLASATFNDLRDTALTRLALAGCTIPEIAAVSGHSERSVAAVLKHYLALGDEIAANAIAKLLAYEDARQAAQTQD